MTLIQVLGPGCPRCTKAEKVVSETIAEAGIEARIEKITDMQKIAAFAVFSTPAVVVNGDVKISGKIPTPKQILEWVS